VTLRAGMVDGLSSVWVDAGADSTAAEGASLSAMKAARAPNPKPQTLKPQITSIQRNYLTLCHLEGSRDGSIREQHRASVQAFSGLPTALAPFLPPSFTFLLVGVTTW
jgi:hypothetical protein